MSRSSYQLARYDSSRGVRAGLVIDDRLFDLADIVDRPEYASTMTVLEDWEKAEQLLSSISPARQHGQPLGEVRLRAPIKRPGAIYCVGANYHDHAVEMRKATGQPQQPDPHDIGLKPWFFIKSSHTVSNPGDCIPLTHYSKKLDWEVELVAVVGRKARNLTIDNALSCIAGYTIGNDLSARDRGTREQVPVSSPMRPDWTSHKSFDGSAPLGPWITPASIVGDPNNLQITLRVNDKIKQNSSTAQMIFTVREQIAHLSSSLTLHPGDIIMTGTPAGVGAPHNDFLKAGDVVMMEIEKIGHFSFSIA